MLQKTHKYILQSISGSGKSHEEIGNEIFQEFYVPTSLDIFNNWEDYLEATSPIIYATLIHDAHIHKDIIHEVLDCILSFIVNLENSNMYISEKYNYLVFDKQSTLFFILDEKIRKYIESE